MPGETPSAPNTTLTAPPLENVPVAKTKPKIGRRLGKIPSELLFSPAGAVLIVFATTIEVIDWLSLGTSSVTGIALDAIFAFFLAIIAKIPLLGVLIPFLIERIPGLGDILPTWVIRLFI